MRSTSEPWPPVLPDITRDALKGTNLEVLAIGALGYVYKCNGYAYKMTSFQREFDMMKKAGDCSIKPVGRVMELHQGRPVMSGLLMELATSIDVKKIPESERAVVKDEMIQLITNLHKTHRIVHGDIKFLNMLRCKDGKLRLCDFDSARPMDEAFEAWEGLCTDRYLSPNRNYIDTGAPPTESDDNYALGLCLWELYTGKEALADEDIEKVLKERRTVDIEEIHDDEVRELVRGLLRQGGADV